MKNEASFIEACQRVAEDIQNIDTNLPIFIFSHFDADGLTAASILLIALSQAGFTLHLKIVERLEYETVKNLNNSLPKGCTIIFSDIGTGILDAFLDFEQSFKIFILDHHSLSSEIDLPRNIKFLNPHSYSLNGTTDVSGAGIAYFVSKQINPQNQKLAPLALIGALGDRQDQGEHSSFIGLNDLIVKDALELKMVSNNVTVWFFDRSRSIDLAIKGSRFPGIENDIDIRNFIDNLEIPRMKRNKQRTFYDLNEEEKRLLASELIVNYGIDANEIYKHDYQLINEETLLLKDARVFATKLNACGKSQRSDIGIALCLGDRNEALRDLRSIEQDYKKQISQSLNWALSEGNLQELSAIHYLDGRLTINDRIIGTIVSMISARRDIGPKPVLGCAKISSGKIKISMRISRSQEKEINLSQLLTRVIQEVEPDSEVGGHSAAAGAIISESSLHEFIKLIDQLVLEGMN
ncbi:MAG: DHHA1 domain-containing protein [Candidatus Hermodarchaeota archaeon]